MLSRVILAVLLCGLTAGFAMGVIQQARLTPLIIQAESFEGGHSHAHGDAATAHDHGAAGLSHDGSSWAPADGFERTFFTYATAMLTGAGFAALLAGIAFVTGAPITRANGWVWGLAGFAAASLAPAAGLAPELPGMPAADLTARQIWWVGTIAATGTGLWLMAFRRESWALPAALVLLVLPHVIGAPQPADQASAVPAGLASQFAGASLAANALMWIIIGWMLGRFLPQPDVEHAQ